MITVLTCDSITFTLRESPRRNFIGGWPGILSPAECAHWNTRLDAWLMAHGVKTFKMADSIRADVAAAKT